MPMGKKTSEWAYNHVFLLLILLACTAVEGILQGADHGLWGSIRWRSWAYEYGGFWRGLLGSWQPNYTAQPVLMFVSYGFLHGGAAHLLLNMITLFSLGRLVAQQVGQSRFAAIYGLTLLGGALGFALFSTAVQPMVGASGALFGLAGTLISWEYIARRSDNEGLGPVVRVVSLLIGLNIAMYFAMDGNLAWETHLGGFVTGWVTGRWFQNNNGSTFRRL